MSIRHAHYHQADYVGEDHYAHSDENIGFGTLYSDQSDSLLLIGDTVGSTNSRVVIGGLSGRIQRFCLLRQMYSVLGAPSVCLSVTLVHPAEAAGRNEMLFGRDTRMVPNTTVLDTAPRSPGEGEIWGS